MKRNRILIADDVSLNREMLTEMLGDKYDFTYAANGIEAIDAMRGKDTIDLLLLDLNMPQMDGFEVLRIMNERHWIDECPVIMISAEDSAQFIEQAYKLGVVDYISAPSARSSFSAGWRTPSRCIPTRRGSSTSSAPRFTRKRRSTTR